MVGADGSQHGVVSLKEALDAAAEANLDLAEIAPSAQPPVVKILDWGKFRYEQVRLGLKIGEHDLQVKLGRAQKFLEQGHKVKVSLLFRGREITRPELGRAILTKVMAQLEEVAVQEQSPQLSGRDLNMIIGPKKDTKDAKA